MIGVGLDGQRAEREVLGYFGIGHAGRHERDDLALPGFNGPLVLVAQASSAADTGALQSLVTRLPIPAAGQGTSLRVYVGGPSATLAFGMGAASPVEAFLPVFMLPILFGLSTDYQVFLVSRMNEEWVRSRDNGRAVRAGQAGTARVITAAAAIMICVFVTFALTDNWEVAEFGVGLAAAVALDAFILRTVLVPALMHMSGNANWSLPGWLDRRLPVWPSSPANRPRFSVLTSPPTPTGGC